MNIKKIAIFLFVLGTLSCNKKTPVAPETKSPKNVIFLISDGTGLSQISSAFYFKQAEPNYKRFETIGLINTSSSREDVTDSAAGATAFASGVKTYNGAIGVADDSTFVKNLTEFTKSDKVKTGLVATSSITHATPAGFYAHNITRNDAEGIALDLLNSEIDFFAGGGLEYFNKREDQLDLLQEFKKKEFLMDTIALGSFDKISAANKVGYLLAEDGMPKMLEGRGNFLPEATQLGIQFLNKKKEGFFLMTEGSQIDWGGHDNDAPYLISELIDFDEAIGVALDFAEKDGNTLVIVTSDHETGGFALSAKRKTRSNGTTWADYSEVGTSFATDSHSATLIPVFAYGPGAEVFGGIYENTAIYDKILEVTGWNKK